MLRKNVLPNIYVAYCRAKNVKKLRTIERERSDVEENEGGGREKGV